MLIALGNNHGEDHEGISTDGFGDRRLARCRHSRSRPAARRLVLHWQLRRESGRAVLRVCDHGPGVPASQRERIFEPFYRLPGASEREGGVGLGLALVRSIAERHGGSAQCDNCPGGGARFTLRLPTARHAA